MSNIIDRNAGIGLLLLASIFSAAAEAYAPSWGYDGNRIAISADGNSAPDDGHHWKTGDPDDWGATPAALAILAKLQMQDQLVHYSYNNFIAAPAGPDDKNKMKIGVDGAIARWGFDEDKFFDVTKQLNAAKEHLRAELEKSTADDPLYYIHMGPSEFFYQVVAETVDQGDADALQHVYIVSHSGYNDEHLRRDTHHTLQQAIDFSGERLNYKRIKDQNGKWDPNVLWNSEQDFSPWYWLRDHRDPSLQWLYRRMQANAKGVADISDAGMLYWLLLGDEDGSPAKFKAFLGEGIPNGTVVDDESASHRSDRDLLAQRAAAVDAGRLLIVQAEAFPLQGAWVKVPSDDASGGAYIEYTGPNRYTAVDGRQTIEMPLTIDAPGSYTVKWFMRQPADAEGDKSNDVWLNFPDAVQKGNGQELTGFHKFVGRSKGEFGMNGQLDLHGNQPWLNVTFDQPGDYTLQLSGRSELLQIDRFILYRDMSFDEAQALARANAPEGPLNVLFLVSDDLNSWLLEDPDRYAGKVKAPNLKKLAAGGVNFKYAYTASPVCSPSRTAFFSGVAPWTSGHYHNALQVGKSEPLKNTRALSLAGCFKRAGYTTLGYGKITHGWDQKEHWDEKIGHKRDPAPPGAPISSVGGGEQDWAPIHLAEEDMNDTGNANRAIAQLQKKHDKPFFIACGLFNPHMPWYVPQKYFDMYPLDDITTPVLKENDLEDVPPLGRLLTKGKSGFAGNVLAAGLHAEAVQAYLATTTYVDTQLGRVLDALDKSPYRDNTLVVFLTDHGFHLAEKSHWQKATLWEEATHCLLMFRVPGVTRPGGFSERFVSLMDVYPTLVELCGLEAPDYLDGRSLVSLLKDPQAPWESTAITGLTDKREPEVPYISIRNELGRYIRYGADQEEYYSTSKDPHEWTNEIANPDYAGVVNKLRKLAPGHAEAATPLPSALAKKER